MTKVIALIVAFLRLWMPPAPTTTTLNASPNPSTFGQPITLTANVSPNSATGKVTFYDGVTVLGVGTLSGGHATISSLLIASGSRSLRAHYAGDASISASTSALVQQAVVALPQNGFQPAVSYADGINPYSVATADFNEDGKADIVVVSDHTSILIGKGDGTFWPAVSVGAPSGTSVTVGDFNGDGHADIAVTNDGVSVLLGNGDGTFQAGGKYVIANLPTSVVVSATEHQQYSTQNQGDVTRQFAASRGMV